MTTKVASPTDRLRSTAVYLGTIVSAQLASFVLLPIITRYLGPDQYGEYALALAVSGLVGTVATSWIRNVAFRYYYDERAAGNSRTFYWSLILLQALVVVITFGLTAILLPRISQDIVSLRILLAAATMVIAADFQALTLAFVRAEEQSGRYAAGEIAAAVTRLLGTTAGLIIGFRDPAFLFFAAAGASAIGSFVAFAGLSSSLLGRPGVSVAAMGKVIRHVFGALPFSLGQWLGNLSDRLVLNAYASTAAVGIYSAGFSLGDRIIGGLVEAVFMMSWPDIMNSWAAGGHALARQAVRRYFQIYLWLTVGPLFALVTFGHSVVAVLGSSYSDAVNVLGLVAFAAWIRGLSRGFNRHFELEKRFYALSLVTIFGAIINLALNLVLVPKHFAIGAGISALASQLLMALTYFIIRDRRLVSFPIADLLIILPFSIGLAFLVVGFMGTTLSGLLLYALTYSALMGIVWGRRVLKRKVA